jgi:hypothetical protein
VSAATITTHATLAACRARLRSNLAEQRFLATLPASPERSQALARLMRSSAAMFEEIMRAKRFLPQGGDGAEEGQP